MSLALVSRKSDHRAPPGTAVSCSAGIWSVSALEQAVICSCSHAPLLQANSVMGPRTGSARGSAGDTRRPVAVDRDGNVPNVDIIIGYG